MCVGGGGGGGGGVPDLASVPAGFTCNGRLIWMGECVCVREREDNNEEQSSLSAVDNPGLQTGATIQCGCQEDTTAAVGSTPRTTIAKHIAYPG